MEKALTQTLLAAIKPLKSSLGFTLIEIMIVLGIILAVVAIGVPKLANRKGQMRGEIQRIAILSRELFNAARLQNRTFRIVFVLTSEGSKYRVESSSGQVALLSEEQQKEFSDKSKMRQEELAKLNKPKFELEPKYTKKEQVLPSGLMIDSIEYAGKKTPSLKPESKDLTREAMIYYFPQGLTEQALIHFTNGKTLSWTIVIHPLTGKALVNDGKITLKDLGS